jgi:hypothetical protein
MNSTMRVASSTHFIGFDLITLVVLGKGNKLTSFLHGFTHVPVNFLPFNPTYSSQQFFS